MFFWFQSYTGSQRTETISYSDFKQWVQQGKVEDLVVGPEQITGKLKGEKANRKEHSSPFGLKIRNSSGSLSKKGSSSAAMLKTNGSGRWSPGCCLSDFSFSSGFF